MLLDYVLDMDRKDKENKVTTSSMDIDSDNNDYVDQNVVFEKQRC